MAYTQIYNVYIYKLINVKHIDHEICHIQNSFLEQNSE